MAAVKRSLTDDHQLRRRSSDVTQDSCKISEYNTFEQEEVPDGNVMKNRKIIVITFGVAILFVGMMRSLVAPFYAAEAQKKGASLVVAGFIIAMYDLVCLSISPVIGNHLATIGAKLTYVGGLTVCGVSLAAFGCLDAVPSGATYIVMSLLVRSIMALGYAGFCTAALAILAKEFPNNIATIDSVMEMCLGIGSTIGPALGLLLYQAGGFRLPFLCCGAFVLFAAFLGWILLPPQSDVTQKERKSFWSFVGTLPVILLSLIIIFFHITFGFYDTTFAGHVDTNYHFSTSLRAVVFVIGNGVFTVTIPVWGMVADKKKRWGPVLVILGGLTVCISLMLVGPSPFLHISNHPEWVLYISLVAMGLGASSVPAIVQQLVAAAIKQGYPDTLDTYGMVAGFYMLSVSIGAFVGPIAGGYLCSTLGFERAATVLSCTGLFVMSLWVLYTVSRSCHPDKTDETSPMLKDPTE